MSDDDSDQPSPRQNPRQNGIKFVSENQQQHELAAENRKLRYKLNELSTRLDLELQKAAEAKLKAKSQTQLSQSSPEAQQLELQNAYKMIERLQRSVKAYQSKDSYHISVKHITDLENIIAKKDNEVQELKAQVKLLKKTIREKDKHVDQLIEQGQKPSNPTEERDNINKYKAKIKSLLSENEQLRKKELEKHEKLVLAERKITELEQDQRQLNPNQEETVALQLKEYKGKYREAMQRVERQNLMITKLNERLDKRESAKPHSQRLASKSVDELPALMNAKLLPLEHLPAQLRPLKRY